MIGPGCQSAFHSNQASCLLSEASQRKEITISAVKRMHLEIYLHGEFPKVVVESFLLTHTEEEIMQNLLEL